jgi:hypothetical protein
VLGSPTPEKRRLPSGHFSRGAPIEGKFKAQNGRWSLIVKYGAAKEKLKTHSNWIDNDAAAHSATLN